MDITKPMILLILYLVYGYQSVYAVYIRTDTEYTHTGAGLTSFPDISGRVTIQQVVLYSNNIQLIPVELLEGMDSITKLHISGNRLTRFPVMTDIVDTLEYLGLAGNQISTIPSELLAGMDMITFFSVADNQLTVFPDMRDIGDTLERLFLHQNQIYHIPVGYISVLVKLRELRLHVNRLTTITAEVWSVGTALCSVRLDDNPTVIIQPPIETRKIDVSFDSRQLSRVGCHLAYLEDADNADMMSCSDGCNITSFIEEAKAVRRRDLCPVSTCSDGRLCSSYFLLGPEQTVLTGKLVSTRSKITCMSECLSEEGCSGISYSKTKGCAKLFNNNADPALPAAQDWIHHARYN